MEFALRNNIVAVEHGPSFVLRDRHCNTLWNTSTHHVADGSTPQIMEEFPRNTRSPDCAFPRPLELANILSFVKEDVLTFWKGQIANSLS